MRGAVHRILCIRRKLLETCRLRVRFCPAGIGRRLQRGGKQQKRRLAKSLTGHDCRDRHNSIGADYAESVHNSGVRAAQSPNWPTPPPLACFKSRFVSSPPIGGYESLGIPAQNTFASAINSAGEVAGSAGIQAACNTGPVIWNAAGQPQSLSLNGLIATLPPSRFVCNGTALGINDNGVAVGSVFVEFLFGDRGTFAFKGFAQNTSVEALGELPLNGLPFTEANGINNSETVVGTSNGRAFLWTAGVGIQDLNSLLDESGIGWTLVFANAINDATQIVGYGDHNGETRAFLLAPATPCEASLPFGWPTASDANLVSQDYGEFNSPGTGRPNHYHTGMDLASPTSGVPQQVFAAAKGEVVAVCQNENVGGCVFGGTRFSENAGNHGFQGVVILKHAVTGSGISYSL